jgi:2-deoxy-D-gluconate 3-dehydrogenase
VLVNNAGIYPMVTLAQMTSADFDKVIAVNLRGVFLCIKYVSEKMIARGAGGKIINITSIDALHPSSVGLAHYDATKHGIWGFTKNVALELAPHHIAVNAVAPGSINTHGGKTAEEIAHDPAFAQYLKQIPMNRFGEPDDIGRAVLFLASDLSSYMTGSQVVVDGGRLLS